jgi:ArsR family transcriptional regulator
MVAARAQGCRITKPNRVVSLDGQQRFALAFKAMGDPTRLAMLEMIVAAEELCSCEIEPSFALSQPTISHHLKLLREAGLIAGERRGTWVYYRAIPETIAELREHPIFRRA